MTEQECIARARAGDETAFTPLVESYQAAIYNLCYRMLGNPQEAEDAAQEAFLRAYSQLRRYDPSRSFKTWLFSIASHYCIDLLRKRRLTWLSIEDEALPPHPALHDPTLGPEESATRREQTAAIQGLLGRLAPDDRTVIVMRYWYDLSYEEIAEATGATVSAVKSRLHRARGALAEMLPGERASAAAAPARAATPRLAVGGWPR
ncbi:MAG: sigma-70 family RNA polymerase sigma factor [Anaerolineales bacterium]|nr:sigma-70 family RNA polymerase sigma factor [Anaerolineales bacterium]